MENETFTYSYRAQEQEEINKIRKKYLPSENTKMEDLRKLDRGVTKKARIVSLSCGILSTLVLGVGMCCSLVWVDKLFIAGIIIGLAGIGGMVAAYPLYSAVLKKERERVAPLILKLTDELTRQNGNKTAE